MLTNWAAGVVLGAYLWQFVRTNQDFTGPIPVSPALGLALTLVLGPAAVWVIQGLSAWALSWFSGHDFQSCLRRDAPSMLPLGLLGLSVVVGLLTGWHSPAYHAAVVVLASLAFSGCLALKAATAWQLKQAGTQRLVLSDRQARRILVAVIVAYALVFVGLQVLRYNAYQLWGVDHTRVTQGLWNTLHGRFLAFTFVDGIDLNLLADHFELIYVLLVPLYWLWPDPRLPLVIQVIALSLAAWPLYHLVLRRLKSPGLALVWALTYLILPMTVAAAQDSAGAVRPDALAIPIFMFMLDALDREHWGVFALTVALAFGAKQYLSLLVAMLGLWLAIRQGRRALGLALFAGGVLWFVVLVQWLMPALGEGPNLTLTAQFGPAAGEAGLIGIARLLLEEPGRFLEGFFSYQLLFLFFLLFSFGGLPLLDPLVAAVSLPIFAVFALAQSHRTAVNLADHHYYPIVPFLLVASVNGVRFAANWAEEHLHTSPRCVAVALTAFALGMSLSASFFWVQGPWSWSFWNRRAQAAYWGGSYLPGGHARLADEFVGMVPAGAPVLASDYLLAHLPNRPRVYHFFRPPQDVLDRVDYVVADLLQNRVRTESQADRESALLGELLGGATFGLTAYEDGLLFFDRAETNGYASRIDVLDYGPQPVVVVRQDLGERLRLLGYDPPLEPVQAGERSRVTYYWQVLDGFSAPFRIGLGINPESVELHQTDYVLADRFSGPAGEFSVLHLPTLIQMPPQEWRPGQILREIYEFRIPVDADGDYEWSVGTYSVPRFLGIRVNEARQVPGAVPVALGPLAIQPQTGAEDWSAAGR